jgi:hypothetical protein
LHFCRKAAQTSIERNAPAAGCAHPNLSARENPEINKEPERRHYENHPYSPCSACAYATQTLMESNDKAKKDDREHEHKDLIT